MSDISLLADITFSGDGAKTRNKELVEAGRKWINSPEADKYIFNGNELHNKVAETFIPQIIQTATYNNKYLRYSEKDGREMNAVKDGKSAFKFLKDYKGEKDIKPIYEDFLEKLGAEIPKARTDNKDGKWTIYELEEWLKNQKDPSKIISLEELENLEGEFDTKYSEYEKWYGHSGARDFKKAIAKRKEALGKGTTGELSKLDGETIWNEYIKICEIEPDKEKRMQKLTEMLNNSNFANSSSPERKNYISMTAQKKAEEENKDPVDCDTPLGSFVVFLLDKPLITEEDLARYGYK